MMAGDLSVAEVYEQGLPPHKFAARHFDPDLPRRSGETDAGFRRRSAERWLVHLTNCLRLGLVTAAGVLSGPGLLRDDPRLLFHPAHWRVIHLRRDDRLPDHIFMIDDRVTMPTGEEVVEIRVVWASGATPEPAASSDEEPSPECEEQLREAAFEAQLQKRMDESPVRLIEVEFKVMALHHGVTFAHAYRQRDAWLAANPDRRAAYQAPGSTPDERARSKAAKAEIKRIEKQKAASKR